MPAFALLPMPVPRQRHKSSPRLVLGEVHHLVAALSEDGFELNAVVGFAADHRVARALHQFQDGFGLVCGEGELLDAGFAAPDLTAHRVGIGAFGLGVGGEGRHAPDLGGVGKAVQRRVGGSAGRERQGHQQAQTQNRRAYTAHEGQHSGRK